MTLFEVGDEVYYAGAIDRPGTNSHLHAVDERVMGPKLTMLIFGEAAALPLKDVTVVGTASDPVAEMVRELGADVVIDHHELIANVKSVAPAQLVDAGPLRIMMTTELTPFDAAILRPAHQLIESGHTRGKVAVTGFPAQ